MSIVTPIMLQYQAIKEQYSDCLLFFRLGDFYEMFNDDAITASRELSLVLTSRRGGGDTKVPMCGVPKHAAESYIARLLDKNYKVAICEQLEDAKKAKGLVKRDVVRVFTPGTVLEDSMLVSVENNYLASCWRTKTKGVESGFGLAYVDISTGEFYATQIEGLDLRGRLADELIRIAPAELILPADLYDDDFFQLRIKSTATEMISHNHDDAFVNNHYEDILTQKFNVANLDSLGMHDYTLAAKAAASIVVFLQHTQKRSLQYFSKIRLYSCSDFMNLDSATRRNLELTSTSRRNKKKGSLLWVLDSTQTAMGGRLIREWIESPLLSPAAINMRLDAVEELIEKQEIRNELREQLRELYDLPRLISRICFGTASPKDLGLLRSTLLKLPNVYRLLGQLRSPFFAILFNNFYMLDDVCCLLQDGLSETPPPSAKDFGVIRDGYNSEVDRLRNITNHSKELILEMEAEEREKTGIKNLKIAYNKVFGYYIELSKTHTADAPSNYVRKQTLTNGERYITEELKELETAILTSGDKLGALEYELFRNMRNKTAESAAYIQHTADVIANLDVIQSLATIAVENGYCKPIVNDEDKIIIHEGRHPVVEKIIGEENYIANDTYLDANTQRMMLITGPNMTGKSTYMRQVALCVLMARIGSYVPASSAVVGACDRIFTRVGAADDLSTGQSTFMLEMNETSNILHHATNKSLIILDEIGRGTSTFDGLSIAWAVAEYIINDKCGAKTLFATHYHELIGLEDNFPLIKNYSIAVKEQGNNILFLRKIVKGGADRSYGIHVAKLAGLPDELILRAEEILLGLEEEQGTEIHSSVSCKPIDNSSRFSVLNQKKEEEDIILEELKRIDIDSMTPLDALMKIAKWKQEL